MYKYLHIYMSFYYIMNWLAWMNNNKHHKDMPACTLPKFRRSKEPKERWILRKYDRQDTKRYERKKFKRGKDTKYEFQRGTDIKFIGLKISD